MLALLILLPWIVRAEAVTDVSCTPVPGSPCSAELCLLEPTGGYSRPTAWISVPEAPVQRFRIHLHGWSHKPSGEALNPSYDFAWPSGKTPAARDALKMVLAYGLHRDVCEPSADTVIMPLSRGHVDDYKALFKNSADFTKWKNAVTGMIRTQDLPWTLSAHSGGGAIAAQAIDPDDTLLDRVILLDATYDPGTAAFFKTWVTRINDPLNPRTLEVVSVTSPTAKHSRSISIPGPAEVDGFTRTVRTSAATLIREIRNDQSFDHYSIVPARWDTRQRRP